MMVSEGAGKGQVSVKEEAEKDAGAPGRWKGPGHVAFSRLLTLPTHSFPLYSLSIKQIVVKGTELS